MWLMSCFYNFHLSSKLKNDNSYDKNKFAENIKVYAFVDILMLGSLDMMVIYPWSLDESMLKRNLNYPSKHALDLSIKSQAVKVDRGTANDMPSPSPPPGETHCCLSFRPLSSLSARISHRWHCKCIFCRCSG